MDRGSVGLLLPDCACGKPEGGVGCERPSQGTTYGYHANGVTYYNFTIRLCFFSALNSEPAWGGIQLASF